MDANRVAKKSASCKGSSRRIIDLEAVKQGYQNSVASETRANINARALVADIRLTSDLPGARQAPKG